MYHPVFIHVLLLEFQMREDILSRFLVESKKDPVKMNNQYLRDIILNFIIAGRDTTAITLSWFFYMLCKHPSLQEKLAREVNEATAAVDDPTPIIDFASSLTEESLDRMQYLHASLAETLRLYPAIPEVNFSIKTDHDSINATNLTYTYLILAY